MTIPGKNRNLPALVSGSHVDSVPQGGNYDGLAGVVAALTVARWMREINYVPERDYTVLMMRMEESSWFGKCYVGSLGMTGQLTEQDLALKHRSTGKTLKETIKACGFNPDDLTTGVPVVDLAKMAAFIELHIEQGPTLDSSDTRVGIVTGIRGNFRHKTIKCIGETAHSGAVDKQFRHDAVLAMAELAYKMDCLWDDWLKDGKDLVFTIGVVHTAATSAIAIVPGEVTFCCDIRSLHRETLVEFYSPEDLSRIVLRTAKILGVVINNEGAAEIGRRSRGTPRIANRLLRRVRDFALVHGDGNITAAVASKALEQMDVDELGLDQMDRKILNVIIRHYDGGPVGVRTLAAACSEEIRTIEEIYEPFLIQSGFLKRTPRGRMATSKAFKHLKLLG